MIKIKGNNSKDLKKKNIISGLNNKIRVKNENKVQKNKFNM